MEFRNSLLVKERESVLRLLPKSESAESAKNEEDLLIVMKEFAIKNGWDSKGAMEMPVWLLTGHIVQDANPNFWQYSTTP